MKLSVEARNARAAALAKMLAGGRLCIVSSAGGEIASVLDEYAQMEEQVRDLQDMMDLYELLMAA